MRNSDYELAAGALSPATQAGKDKPAKTPKKKLRSIHVRGGKKGGYIAEHHHEHPAHPMEEHVLANKAAMLKHMSENDVSEGAEPNEGGAGDPNGEMEELEQ